MSNFKIIPDKARRSLDQPRSQGLFEVVRLVASGMKKPSLFDLSTIAHEEYAMINLIFHCAHLLGSKTIANAV